MQLWCIFNGLLYLFLWVRSTYLSCCGLFFFCSSFVFLFFCPLLMLSELTPTSRRHPATTNQTHRFTNSCPLFRVLKAQIAARFWCFCTTVLAFSPYLHWRPITQLQSTDTARRNGNTAFGSRETSPPWVTLPWANQQTEVCCVQIVRPKCNVLIGSCLHRDLTQS